MVCRFSPERRLNGLHRIGLWLLLACGTSAAPAVLAQAATRQDAIALEQQGKNNEAADVWRAIAQADPHNAEAFAHLGLIEARQEHYGEAIANYRKALALNNSFPKLEMNLGL